MKTILRFWKKFGYKLKFLKKEKSISRFTPIQREFLGKDIFIHDIASFNLGLNEIFKKEVYKFNCTKKIPYILDCGANLGMSIIYFKQLYPKAEIIGFEPDDHIYFFLKKNIDSFGLENVKIINKALFNIEGELSFYEEGGAGGRIEIDDQVKKYKTVSAERLRPYLIGRKVDFLKIDIEGAEFSVLNDCSDLLFNVENIFVEYHSFPNKPQKLHEILKILQKSGFKYHIKEAFTSKNPYVNINLNVGMDLQLNIFGYRI